MEELEILKKELAGNKELLKHIEELKGTLDFYKESYEKYTRLQAKVNQLQNNVNDGYFEEAKDINDVKMQVFELWYFSRYNKEYN